MALSVIVRRSNSAGRHLGGHAISDVMCRPLTDRMRVIDVG
jgi:hypothetical protein